MWTSTITTKFDPTKLPEDYVTRKFYEYGYKVEQHGTTQYRCCCPICREGNSWGKKKRCWWLPAKNLVYCFNCGHGYSPYNWIKQVSGMNCNEIKKEVQDGEYDIIDLDAENRYSSYERSNWDSDSLPENPIDLNNEQQMQFYHSDSVVRKCVQYIQDRRLDTAINVPEHLFLSLTDRVHRYRLVFPFYDSYGNVSFYQSRSFGGNPDTSDEREKIRYLGKVGAKKTIFNFHKINPDIRNVYVFEGPIDSCFVRNGIAVAGISAGQKEDLTQEQESQIRSLELLHDIVWVLDSQWLDETSLEKTQILLQKGERVFVWPKLEGLLYKDFNEMAIALKKDEISQEFLEDNILDNEADFLPILEDIKKEKSNECSSHKNENDLWSVNLTDLMSY